MGLAEEFFYTFDENNELVTLEKIHTNGYIIEDGELIGHYRAKEIEGEQVSITESEYCKLMRQYGSSGYGPFEDTGEIIKIDLTWNPITEYGGYGNAHSFNISK